MKSAIAFTLSAFVALMAFVDSASGAAVIVNQTLDLTQPKAAPGPGFQGWQGTPAFDGGYSVTIAEGDTFDFAVDFLGAQSLTLTNAVSLWLFSYADISSGVTGTGQLSLLDAAGNAFLTSNLKTDTESAVHFGQFFLGSDFAGGLPTNLTFWGVRYEATLDDYTEDGVTSRTYEIPAFYVDAETAVVNASEVPEPVSIAMWGLGALGLVFAGHRRRQMMLAA